MDTDIYIYYSVIFVDNEKIDEKIDSIDNEKYWIIKRSNEMHYDHACSHQANRRICD